MEIEETERTSKKEVVLSYTTIAISVIVTILAIVAVGLIVGLVGRPSTNCEDVSIPPPVVTSTQPSTTIFPNSNGTDVSWANPRLPTSLIPLHYIVDLRPDLEPDSSGYYWFYGRSEVTFDVATSTDVIILHSNRLNVSVEAVLDEQGNPLLIETFWPYEKNQYLVVELRENLTERHNYTLKTNFHGELSDSLAGLYRSNYVDANGSPVTIAVTQMWPTDARKTFPCFDEPALKATFDIIVRHKDTHIALSNMPVKSVQAEGGWTITKFEQTVKMTTYLFAVVVSPFDYVESLNESNPEITTRIYARPEQVSLQNVDYAKNITPIILEYYAEYFGVNYPLPKLDQVAIPDFAFGGMENWGLVTYRETALLYNDTTHSVTNKQRVAAVIAHEIAHQWFGNLISPLWWDEFWLSEGFATFIEYLGQDKVQPSWRMMDQFILIDLYTAFYVDGLATSRPIIAQNVTTPADINALVDDISYSKASCIIRMISEFAGEEAFKLGLKNYLEDFSYGSVEHTKLFEYWEEAASQLSQSIPPGGYVEAMNPWVLQMGYPVLKVTRSEVDPSIVNVQQSRFLLDPNADPTQPQSPYDYKWVIPFWYKHEDDQEKSLEWLTKESHLQLEVPTDKYIIGNYEVFGYYRVNYDEGLWNMIIDELNSNYVAINVKNRGQLIDDAFNFARIGQLNYETSLSTTSFLRDDFDYVPWQSALNVLGYFDQVLGRSNVYGIFSDYMVYLVQPLYNNVTWYDGGTHIERLQRINAISVACSYGDSNCTEEALIRFDEWKKDPIENTISPNLRELVYCQAVRDGDYMDWNYLWELYLNESDSQEKGKMQNSLTCTKEPWIIQWLLDQSLNPSIVRTQDVASIWISLCGEEHARDMTWDHIQRHWDFVYQTYGTSSSFGRIIEGCTARFSTKYELNELQRWRDDHLDELGSASRSFEQAVERTQANIDWRDNYEDILYRWFLNAVDNFPA